MFGQYTRADTQPAGKVEVTVLIRSHGQQREP
jgi:hypothetical protein